MSIYSFLDWFFIAFHSTIILFNLFGWFWKRTRKANLVLLLLTGGSWFILGIWKGIGYCPLTDWHFDVLKKLGVENLPYSYIKYFIDRIFGWDMTEKAAETFTAIFYFLALFCSSVVNIRSRSKKNIK